MERDTMLVSILVSWVRFVRHLIKWSNMECIKYKLLWRKHFVLLKLLQKTGFQSFEIRCCKLIFQFFFPSWFCQKIGYTQVNLSDVICWIKCFKNIYRFNIESQLFYQPATVLERSSWLLKWEAVLDCRENVGHRATTHPKTRKSCVTARGIPPAV